MPNYESVADQAERAVIAQLTGVMDYESMTDRELLILNLQRSEEMQETHAKILEIGKQIQEEVAPLVDKLQRNPMFKMMLGGK